MTNIGEKEIKSQNTAADVPYLLQNTLSVVATSDAGNGVGYTDVRMRGYDGSRINVTVGDVPLNDAESHKVYWVDTPDLLQVSGSVQVSRGATSASTGSGAFGGAINLGSKNFSDKFGVSVEAMYGSYNTNKELVSVASGLMKGHWAVEGQLSHTGSDGYVERASTELFSYALQAGYLGSHTKVKLLSFGGIEHTYNAWDGITKEQMAKDRRYNPCGEIRDDNDNVIGFYHDQKDNYYQTNNHIVVKHQFTSRWSINGTAHYTYGKGWYDQYKNNRKLKEYLIDGVYHDADGDPVSKSNITRRKSSVSHFAGAIAYAVYKNSYVTLDFGASWNTYTSEHHGDVTSVDKAADFKTPAEYYRNFSTKNDGAAFAKCVVEPFKGFNILADIQYRYVDYRVWGKNDVYDYSAADMQHIQINKTFNFINPKFGISYSFANYHKVYASAAMANREPTRKDFINALGLEEPRPERLYDVELGYTVGCKWVAATANLYYMIYKDQLVLNGRLNPDTYEPLYMNIPNSFRRGIELDLKVMPVEWFYVGGNVTLSQNKALEFTDYVSNYDTYEYDAIYCGTTNLAYSPSVIAAIKAGFNTHGFTADWQTRYVGKQYFTNASNENMTLDPYWVSDLNLGYKLALKNDMNITFGVALNNLFNAEYCSNAYVYERYISKGKEYIDSRYFPQAKFNAMAKVKFDF